MHERIDAIASAVVADLQSDLDDAALATRATAHIASLDDVLALPDMQPSVDGDGPVVLTWTRALRAALQRVIDATTAAATGDIDREATALLVLADRSRSLADQMRFGFLYDRTRHLFSIGYRLADADGPGVLDPSFYDLLASEARLASFIAIARGDVPQQHWFHLGRRAMSVEGVPTLLSWSATMFEYLMPSLLMRSFPGTLLETTNEGVVIRQIQYGRQRDVPWGISESAYNVRDRHDTYQYRAFGVPGLGFKRGLADDLVIAPYATALALPVAPRAALQNLARLTAAGAEGPFGYYESVDYTPRLGPDPPSEATRPVGRPERRGRPHVHGAPPGHDPRWRPPTRCWTT